MTHFFCDKCFEHVTKRPVLLCGIKEWRNGCRRWGKVATTTCPMLEQQPWSRAHHHHGRHHVRITVYWSVRNNAMTPPDTWLKGGEGLREHSIRSGRIAPTNHRASAMHPATNHHNITSAFLHPFDPIVALIPYSPVVTLKCLVHLHPQRHQEKSFRLVWN